MSQLNGNEVAIIGMSGRFPGAPNLAAFWQNLCHGEESITYFDDATLRASGVAEKQLADRDYVRSGFCLDGISQFDAEFFQLTPREAQILDPQQRLFLECCWHALEHAGHVPERYDGRIGVYAGVFSSSYLLNIYSQPGLIASLGEMAVRHGNEKDYLTTRLSYKLNLRGPSIAIQTSCSTSLVAVHTAVQSLLAGECDMAISGGVSVLADQETGYLWQTGGLLSPDGHCRPFDVDAAGTVFGNGLGVVVLKRLEEAERDGDTVYAVIKGSAINNDGANKVGFTAPSVQGQAEVIAEALSMAEVSAETIQLVEAHGTGTPLGDPVEIEALTRVWQSQTSRKGYCALGSVKGNLGHLGAASGIAGLIKATLALHHKQLPPTINFTRPNPNIPFEQTPFYPHTTLTPWGETDEHPRRAAVSSFGMGGTNAHLILEEAPKKTSQTGFDDEVCLLTLSARSKVALQQAVAELADHLHQQPTAHLQDVAHTLREGRQTFDWRATITASTIEQAREKLQRGLNKPSQALASPEVALLFPGQGSQYWGMAQQLCQTLPTFRDEISHCFSILRDQFGLDLDPLMTQSTPDDAQLAWLNSTAVTQPALFCIEYAMARTIQAQGVKVSHMLGHSVGELVAATLCGVFTLDAALTLVATRGQLMQRAEPGRMLSVSLPEAPLTALLRDWPALSLAAVNGPELSVVAGPEVEITALQQALNDSGVSTRLLMTSHAFHSAMMDPILDTFEAAVEKCQCHPPVGRWISNLTGREITPEEAISPRYWRDHLRSTVQFNRGLQQLLARPDVVLVECGPGTVLTSLAQAQMRLLNPQRAVSLSRHPKEKSGDMHAWLTGIGLLWSHGVPLNLPETQGQRIALPGYPFQRQHYWIERIYPHHATTAATALEVGAATATATATDDTGTVAQSYAQAEGTEVRVAAIWRELFGMDNILHDDDFFALGGTSLVAIQLISQVRELWGVELSIEVLFEDPTIRGIAAQIDTAQARQPSVEATAEAEDPEMAELLRLTEGLSLEELNAKLSG
ncbi:type I polyketide synthase [Pectobacterium betavasculorum]|uniref:type I polyketide synthase n=1 Tax=Pectobacterium betavasculorum TaxID=55207 RepID=UPI000A9B71E8|nr:type I polyketide synthase [Pectobacterium betavasculorum]